MVHDWDGITIIALLYLLSSEMANPIAFLTGFISNETIQTSQRFVPNQGKW